MNFFDTKEEALAYLEIRRKEALEKINEKGWKVLKDDSFVGAYFPDDSKWTAYLMIITDELIKDLTNYK